MSFRTGVRFSSSPPIRNTPWHSHGLFLIGRSLKENRTPKGLHEAKQSCELFCRARKDCGYRIAETESRQLGRNLSVKPSGLTDSPRRQSRGVFFCGEASKRIELRALMQVYGDVWHSRMFILILNDRH